MAQYTKDVFNLAPGLGRALADPREAEKRAQEASDRARRALAAQIQSQLEGQRLQQQQLQQSAQADLARQALAQQQMQQQASQFEQGLKARSQQSQLQREFQRLMQDDAQEFQAEQGLANRTLRSDLAAMQDARVRDNLLQQLGVTLRGQDLGQSRFEDQMEYRRGRDDVLDNRAKEQFSYQQARDKAKSLLDQTRFLTGARQADRNFALQVKRLQADYGAKQQQAFREDMKVLDQIFTKNKILETLADGDSLSPAQERALVLAARMRPSLGNAMRQLLPSALNPRPSEESQRSVGQVLGQVAGGQGFRIAAPPVGPRIGQGNLIRRHRRTAGPPGSTKLKATNPFNFETAPSVPPSSAVQAFFSSDLQGPSAPAGNTVLQSILEQFPEAASLTSVLNPEQIVQIYGPRLVGGLSGFRARDPLPSELSAFPNFFGYPE